MTTLEASRLELQIRLDSFRTGKERNLLGQFATPTSLALEILREARALLGESKPVHFLDPAIGTGSFYSALLETFPHDQILSARGFEIDNYYGLPAQEFWSGHDLELDIADFTSAEPPIGNRPNLIICNPPYVRHHHLNIEQKRRLADASVASAGTPISGLAGLYCYFIMIAHKWMAEGGIACWLIPSEFMDVNYGEAIRRYLTDRVSLLRIHRFDPSEVQFSDALVSSVIVWIRKERPKRDSTVRMSFGGTLSAPALAREVSVQELAGSSKWSGLVHGPASDVTSTYRLGDFFDIKRGLATGSNNFFVISEEKARELGSPTEFLQPVLPSPRNLDSDVVFADSEGDPITPHRRYLIRCGISEAELRTTNPLLANYLETGRPSVSEAYICRHRKPWFSQENRAAAPIVCTYMGRNIESRERPFRFILNYSRATALNVYLMLYPKRILEDAIRESPELLVAVWEKLQATEPQILLGEGRVYGGGLYKLEPRELANVPADDIFALLSRRTNSDSQIEMFRSERVA